MIAKVFLRFGFEKLFKRQRLQGNDKIRLLEIV